MTSILARVFSSTMSSESSSSEPRGTDGGSGVQSSTSLLGTGPGAELTSRDGRGFAFKGARLTVHAAGGLASVVLEQEFENPFATVLDVTYRLPLSENAAVVGYAFEVEGRRIHGQIDTKAKARERFVSAVAAGHSAALLESSRSNIFTQEIGNVPPGSTMIVRITLEQKLSYVPSGAWEFRFPTVIGPRYSRENDVDAQSVAVKTSGQDIGARMAFELHVHDALDTERHASSAVDAGLNSVTHKLRTRKDAQTWIATFAEETARLDRDVVVRWNVTKPAIGISLAAARPLASKPHGQSTYGLLTVTPPEPGSFVVMPRDLIVLLDTSGSMSGAPLEQAKKAVLCLLDTLSEQDRFEIIEFSDESRAFRPAPLFGNKKAKADARAWVQGLTANSCTEMYSAVKGALQLLRPGSQRQVLLITDGMIGAEAALVRFLSAHLPESCRLHVVGIGSSINRALTEPLARAGRGIEALLDLDEDAEKQMAPLAKRMTQPILTDIVLSGDALLEHAPAFLPDVFQGSPLLAAVKLKPSGGTLTVRGRTAEGIWEDSLQVGAQAPGSGQAMVISLYGQEAVRDLETRWVMGGDERRIDQEIESIGLVFQIVTRMTSMVAIDSEKVHARDKVETDEVPQELPYGTSMASFGAAAPSAMSASAMNAMPELMARAPMLAPSIPMPRMSGAPRMSAPAPAAFGAPPPAQSYHPPPSAPGGRPPVFEDHDDQTLADGAAETKGRFQAEELPSVAAPSSALPAAPEPAALPPALGAAPVAPSASVEINLNPSAPIPAAAIKAKEEKKALQKESRKWRSLALVTALIALLLLLALAYMFLRSRG
jgi:Ca-activated chloride channel homolog